MGGCPCARPFPIGAARNEADMRRSKLLLLSAIIGTLLFGYTISYMSGSMDNASTSSEVVGTGIAWLAVTPHVAFAGIALVFNWVGWLFKANWAALTAGILYAVAIVAFPLWFYDSLVQMVLCFIAFGITNKRNKTAEKS